MKKAIYSFLALAALMSCNKALEKDVPVSVEEPMNEYVELVVFADLGAETRASSTTVAGTYETAVNDLQIVAFDEAGNLAGYKSVSSASTGTISLRTGVKYTVCCVVNGPSVSGKASISAVEGVSAPLGTYNTTGTGGDFVMYGKATMSATLSDSNKSLSVHVKRNVCRVHLVSCTITPPAGVTATYNNCFLSNVATNCSVGGTVTLNSTAGNFSNWYGRKTYSTQASIIDGSTYAADPAALTFSTGQTPYFYSYANANTDAVTAWQSAWAATATRLVVTATWAGTKYYYPVAIPQTVGNTTYDVKMTITGPGVPDPQGPVPSNTDLDVTVTVDPWTGGAEYTGNY